MRWLCALVMLAGCGDDSLVGPPEPPAIDAPIGIDAAAIDAPAGDAAPMSCGDELGLQQGFSSDVNQFDGLIGQLQGFGVRWVRMYWMWPWVEAAQGNRDFTAILTAVQSAHARGLRILLLATGAPSWANGGQGQDFPPTEDHIPDHAAYAAAVATETQPDAIELWNEPNNAGFWASGPDAGRMARMTVAAYAAIKAARPETLVVSGGLTQVQYQPQQYFADEVAATPDFVHSFDAVALHPYNEPADPLQPGGYPNILTVQLPAIHQLLVQGGRGDVPFWFTEYGVATDGQFSVSEADQATYFTHFFDGLADLRGQGIPVGVAILYMMQDWGPYGSSTSEQPFFGLLHSDGSDKPAAATVRAHAAAVCP